MFGGESVDQVETLKVSADSMSVAADIKSPELPQHSEALLGFLVQRIGVLGKGQRGVFLHLNVFK